MAQEDILQGRRNERRHSKETIQIYREPGERDRDRIIYTQAFRRLAGITQVISPDGTRSHHNRLTHVLEVAQIGRRLAQRLCRASNGKQIAEDVGGVDPEIVEMACLAHDLGHPPFGHVAEEELCRLGKDTGLSDGFEGNAQSFRIVTKLAFRREGTDGLDLTRASLNAILKYPWQHQRDDPKTSEKWGAYESETEDFEWARKYEPEGMKTAEAELMDFADDIAYSVHDMEDFFRAGKIPLDRLPQEDKEVTKFMDASLLRLKIPPNERSDYEKSFERLLGFIRSGAEEPFSGTDSQRSLLRALTSALINQFIQGVELHVPTSSSPRHVQIDINIERTIRLLKELTWYYVIKDSSLASQQYGQRSIIRGLFEIYAKHLMDENWDIFPLRSRQRLHTLRQQEKHRAPEGLRVVMDLIAGMTEVQAIQLHQRLTGSALGMALYNVMD